VPVDPDPEPPAEPDPAAGHLRGHLPGHLPGHHPGPPLDLAAHRRRGVETALPALAFVATNAVAGLDWAIVATTAVSLGATYLRHRRRERLGWFLPLTAAYLVGRAIVGIATGSEDVYFGIGIAQTYALGVVLLGSVLVGRPALAFLVPLLLDVPRHVLASAAWRRVCVVLTALWGIQQVSIASFHVWLLARSSASGFVIIRTIVGWPLTAVGLTGALTWAAIHLERSTGWQPFGPLTGPPPDERGAGRADEGGVAPAADR
jgi:hypothetical protein